MNPDRVAALQALLAEDPQDDFALYGLALEHRAGDDPEGAAGWLRRLLAAHPGHLYGHYQLGEVLLALGEPEAAGAVLRQGLAAARSVGDAKAAGEILGLLDLCD